MRWQIAFLLLSMATAPLWAEQRVVYPISMTQTASESPAIELTAEEVLVRGLTEGADALLMSLAIDIERSVLSRLWHQDTEATVGGEARFPSPFGIPRRSIWLAADLETGTTLSASPVGFELREKPKPWGSVHPGNGNEPDYLLDDSQALVVWLVRPTQGAWVLLAGDGATNDLDETPNGVVVLPFDRFEPVGESPPLQPALPLPTDLLVSIDRHSLEYWVAPVRDLIVGGGVP